MRCTSAAVGEEPLEVEGPPAARQVPGEAIGDPLELGVSEGAPLRDLARPHLQAQVGHRAHELSFPRGEDVHRELLAGLALLDHGVRERGQGRPQLGGVGHRADADPRASARRLDHDREGQLVVRRRPLGRPPARDGIVALPEPGVGQSLVAGDARRFLAHHGDVDPGLFEAVPRFGQGDELVVIHRHEQADLPPDAGLQQERDVLGIGGGGSQEGGIRLEERRRQGARVTRVDPSRDARFSQGGTEELDEAHAPPGRADQHVHHGPHARDPRGPPYAASRALSRSSAQRNPDDRPVGMMAR